MEKTNYIKMNKQIVAIIFGIALISLASALTYNITAGEPYLFNLTEQYDYYSIIGNLTEVDLNITQDGLVVTVTIGKYAKADSFEIIFFNKEKEVIHHYSSGRSSTKYKTKYVDRNITQYIERDDIIYTSPDDEVDAEGLCSEETSIVTYISIGLLILCLLFFLIFNIISIKKRKAKEELPEQETPEEVQGE